VILNEREFALHFGYLEERVNKAIEGVRDRHLWELENLTKMMGELSPEECSRQMERINRLTERLKKLPTV
jgi:hypothetical protein